MALEMHQKFSTIKSSKKKLVKALKQSWAKKFQDLNTDELYTNHSRFRRNLSQAKNQKNSTNETRAVFQEFFMNKIHGYFFRVGFPSCFGDFGP